MNDRARVHAFIRELIQEIQQGQQPVEADWLPAILFALVMLLAAIWLGWIG